MSSKIESVDPAKLAELRESGEVSGPIGVDTDYNSLEKLGLNSDEAATLSQLYQLEPIATRIVTELIQSEFPLQDMVLKQKVAQLITLYVLKIFADSQVMSEKMSQTSVFVERVRTEFRQLIESNPSLVCTNQQILSEQKAGTTKQQPGFRKIADKPKFQAAMQENLARLRERMGSFQYIVKFSEEELMNLAAIWYKYALYTGEYHRTDQLPTAYDSLKTPLRSSTPS